MGLKHLKTVTISVLGLFFCLENYSFVAIIFPLEAWTEMSENSDKYVEILDFEIYKEERWGLLFLKNKQLFADSSGQSLHN